MPLRMPPGRGPTGLLLFLCLPVLASCSGGTKPAAEAGEQQPGAATAADAEPAPPNDGASAASPTASDSGPEITEPVIHADGSVTYPHGETIKPLTKEDEELLAKDPEELTKDERRQQAYLRRRKIMLDPDSPGAQHIVETITAIESGELAPPELPAKAEGDGPTK